MEQEKFRVPEDMFPISTVSQFEKAELFLESDFNKTKLIEECQGIISKDEMENVEIMAIAMMDFFFVKNEEIRCLWSFDVKHASLMLTFQNSNLQEVILDAIKKVFTAISSSEISFYLKSWFNTA